MTTTRWAATFIPQARFREATRTWTAPLANRFSTAFFSMSLRPSCRYPTPLLKVSFRVCKISRWYTVYSMSLRPSCRYPKPLLRVSFRVCKTSSSYIQITLFHYNPCLGISHHYLGSPLGSGKWRDQPWYLSNSMFSIVMTSSQYVGIFGRKSCPHEEQWFR